MNHTIRLGLEVQAMECMGSKASRGYDSCMVFEWDFAWQISLATDVRELSSTI